LIHLLGGNLVVESQIGVGTTFSFSMPFAIEESCKITRSVVGARIAKDKFFQSILLVEDEAVNQLATKSILEKADMRVVAVSNGEEAIQEVASGDYGLVLMDIQMPVMDGVEATRKIRNGAAGEGKKKIPIIALTAHAMDGDRESFLGKGIDGYIAKPVDVSLLMSTINEVLYGQE
jgi:CheY-like chemotaxis protein